MEGFHEIYRHIAVKEKQSDHKIVGIISTTDLARYLKQKLMQNQKGYFREELSIIDVLAEEFPELLPQVIRIMNANVRYKKL